MVRNSSGRGFFRTAFDALVAARAAQADRYVSSALLHLDDDTLNTHGYTREALARDNGLRRP